MGIRFLCPNGHKLNVKSFLAGKRAICPDCGAKVIVPDSPEQDFEPRQSGFGDGPIAQFGPGAVSPSVVLEVAEYEVEPLAPRVSAAALPESIVVATNPMHAARASASATSDTAYELRRERTRRNQVWIAVSLLVVVILLAATFAWVLKREATPPPATTAPTTKTTTAVRISRTLFVSDECSHSLTARI
jgi:hypothetical protein